ncbi:MAG: hypothetical protein K9L56_15830 [Clostridiales bacterium]|nr:hypothetical protein [Clostridiales bacterium]
MILDTTVDIYKKTTEDGIGSGSDANWNTAREKDVPATVKKRENLPEVREQIAGQGEVQYSWLCFVPRYNDGTERGIVDSDKVEWDEGTSEINGIFKNHLHIILALQQPEEA